MVGNSIPQTPEELAAYVEQIKTEAYNAGAEKATAQNQKLISDLESEIALVKNNPLEFPRFVGKKGDVFELPMVHPFTVQQEDKSVVEYQPEDFLDTRTKRSPRRRRG